MDSFLFFILTIAIAALGGMIGYKLNLPAGVMLGAMVTTVIFNLSTHNAVFYAELRIMIQIFAGAMIGSRMNQDVVREMRKLVLPIILLVASMFVLNLVFGSTMYYFSSLDAATALFAAAPGGASDMAIIAEDLGAYPPYVAILQLCRLIIIFTCMPLIFKKIAGQIQSRANKQKYSLNEVATAEAHTEFVAPVPKHNSQQSIHFPLLLASAAVGGILFFYFGVTAGALIGSMLGGTIYCVLRGEVGFPNRLKVCMQVGAGAFIGLRVEQETIASLGDLIIPLVIMFIGILAFSFGIAFLIHKVTKLSFLTCMLASTPGGQQEMALLSEDLGADTPSIAIMQTARLVCVIAFFPTLLSFITRWLG